MFAVSIEVSKEVVNLDFLFNLRRMIELIDSQRFSHQNFVIIPESRLN